MSTGIEWTDKTWNPVTGCTKVSAGCKHCYAERNWQRLSAKGMPYEGRAFTDVQCHPERLEQPHHWRKPRMVFVNSMSDLFHEDVPDSFILAVFVTMATGPRHTYQILTKRPERMRSLISGWVEDGLTLREGCGAVLPNVWLGVSCEDQATADERIPLLLQTPAAVRFVSAEPLIGPIDFRELAPWDDFFTDALDTPDPSRRVSWVIVGGESGPKARPMHPDWVRSIRDQCQEAGVPFFFKQWGAWVPATAEHGFAGSVMPDDTNKATWIGWDGKTKGPSALGLEQPVMAVGRTTKKAAGRELDGRTWEEYPV